MSRNQTLIVTTSVVAVLFGVATIVSGARTLQGEEAAVQAAGAVVPFVLWFNTAAGFAYVAAGVGLVLRRRWAWPAALLVALTTALVFAALGVHVAMGGAYEQRTVAAMLLRTVVWILIAIVAYRNVSRNSIHEKS